MAGKAIMEALVAAVRDTPSITVLEGWIAEDLQVDDGRVTGVIARGQGGEAPVPHLFKAGRRACHRWNRPPLRRFHQPAPGERGLASRLRHWQARWWPMRNSSSFIRP
jgi:hypothetical protein